MEMATTELTVAPRQVGIVQPADFMPLLDLVHAKQRRDLMATIQHELLVKDVDFGQIPGTNKPTLLKPGAEKLCSLFGLSPSFELEQVIEDWTGEKFSGVPFFYYRYKCRLTKNGVLIGEGIGSCNSWESKYRWRWVDEAQIPANMDKASLGRKDGRKHFTELDFAVDKAETTGQYGKPAEYWEKFRQAIKDGTARKVEKPTKNGPRPAWEISEGTILYRVPNVDGAPDVVNTVCKMAQKRSLIAGTLIATNASDQFTQDLEDMSEYDTPYTIAASYTVVKDEPAPTTASAPAPAPAPPVAANVTVIGEHHIPSKPKTEQKPTPPPPRPPDPVAAYNARVAELAKKFNQSDLAKFKKAALHPFLDGWFDGKVKGQSPEAVNEALDHIEEAVLADTTRILELMKDPKAYGAKARKENDLAPHGDDGEPSELSAWVEAVMSARQWDEEAVFEHMRHVGLDTDMASDDELIAYLRLAAVTGSSSAAVRTAKKRGVSVAQVVSELEKITGPLSGAPQSDIEVALLKMAS
jgi:hypothetical protein